MRNGNPKPNDNGRSPLDPVTANRLAKLCGMLGSNQAGERASAALKADSLVRSNGFTWFDIFENARVPPPCFDDMKQMVAFCHARVARLSENERGFITSMLKWKGDPSERQQKWLVDIYIKLKEAEEVEEVD